MVLELRGAAPISSALAHLAPSSSPRHSDAGRLTLPAFADHVSSQSVRLHAVAFAPRLRPPPALWAMPNSDAYEYTASGVWNGPAAPYVMPPCYTGRAGLVANRTGGRSCVS